MAYKISAAARDAYAAMDRYLASMRVAGKTCKRLYITQKQHDAICTHLTRVKLEQTKDAKPIKEFKQYKDCEVIIYNG